MNENSNHARERQAAEEIWLMYFNNYLCEKGVITEAERNRMVSKIAGRSKPQTKVIKKKEHEIEL